MGDVFLDYDIASNDFNNLSEEREFVLDPDIEKTFEGLDFDNEAGCDEIM